MFHIFFVIVATIFFKLVPHLCLSFILFIHAFIYINDFAYICIIYFYTAFPMIILITIHYVSDFSNMLLIRLKIISMFLVA